MGYSGGKTANPTYRDVCSHRTGHAEVVRVEYDPAEVSYENGVITSAELNDARLSLLETEWELMQAKYVRIVAAARTRHAAGL